MADAMTHESLFRGDKIQKIKDYTFVLCGCGALGSNVAEGLARHGADNFYLIDFDRVEESNIGTQIWYQDEIGGYKSQVLARRLYRINKAKSFAFIKRFENDRFKAINSGIEKTALVIDVFDNMESRGLTKDFAAFVGGCDCIHAGMSGDGFGTVEWDETYKVSARKAPGVDVCEYPLARNLVITTAMLCVEAVVNLIIDGEKNNYNFTLVDKVIDKF